MFRAPSSVRAGRYRSGMRRAVAPRRGVGHALCHATRPRTGSCFLHGAAPPRFSFASFQKLPQIAASPAARSRRNRCLDRKRAARSPAAFRMRRKHEFHIGVRNAGAARAAGSGRRRGVGNKTPLGQSAQRNGVHHDSRWRRRTRRLPLGRGSAEERVARGRRVLGDCIVARRGGVGEENIVTITKLLAAAALLAVACTAAADEATVRRMVQEQMRRGGTIESVQKTPWGDLYEVVVRGRDGALIYYVDSRAPVIITGSVIDAKTGRNLTEERQRRLDAVKWESLPLQWAITTVRGSGRRKIAILSDPNCPYCKRLEEGLATLDDIPVHILPYAILSPASVRQAKAVWCSKDRAKSWDDLMFRRIEPRAAPDCDTPVEKLLEFGRRIGATATPTWFLESGSPYSRALPLDEVPGPLCGPPPGQR